VHYYNTEDELGRLLDVIASIASHPRGSGPVPRH
jgi:selenocysteine lyase/cysteine desulfurase